MIKQIIKRDLCLWCYGEALKRLSDFYDNFVDISDEEFDKLMLESGNVQSD